MIKAVIHAQIIHTRFLVDHIFTGGDREFFNARYQRDLELMGFWDFVVDIPDSYAHHS